MAGVADEHDDSSFGGITARLHVNLGDERTRRVYRVQPSICSRLHNGRGNTVRAKDNVRADRHRINIVNKDRAAVFEGGHNMGVVNDLLSHIDRSPIVLKGLFDRDNSAINSRAVSARGSKKNSLVSNNGEIP